MKKPIAVLMLLSLFVFVASAFAAQAAPGWGGNRGCADCPKQAGGGPGMFMGRMAQVLDLTDAQKAQIDAIVTEERAKTEPLRQQMFENREQMRQLMHAETLDEGAIRALATKKAEISGELMVAKARTRQLIHAQLTPEQRELADKLQPLMQERRGGKGLFRDRDCYSRQPDCPKGKNLM